MESGVGGLALAPRPTWISETLLSFFWVKRSPLLVRSTEVSNTSAQICRSCPF